jgi:alpha-beta hydrolase superfamily lysophospholipase
MYVSRFADYIEDLEQFYDWFSLSPETTAQLGVSMGGLVTVRFAQTHPDRLAAIALSSPLLGLAVRISPMLLASGRFLSLAYPWKQFRTVVELSDVTRSRESLEQRRADPLCRRIVTAGWFFAVRAAITNAWRDASSLALPVLVVQSGDDRVVDGAAAQAWINRIASADRLFHELPGQFHELHYETSWRATVDLYHNWLAARVVPPLASPATMARAA